MLIAQAVFLLERGHTDRQTDETERPTHAGGYAGGYAGVGNKITTRADSSNMRWVFLLY